MLLPTYAFNFSNFPAISVPAGWTEDGLPVGLQIVGGWQNDALVLRAAAAFEQARPWAEPPPVVALTAVGTNRRRAAAPRAVHSARHATRIMGGLDGTPIAQHVG